jgi:hypothetical protein
MCRRLGGACAALLPLLLIASGCTSEPADPGAVTADEERQLNDAAAMLDANSVSLDAVDDNGTAP